MTYDLTLRPRAFPLDEHAFRRYFNDREGWALEDDPHIASYFNEYTDVYFHVRYHEPDADEEHGALTFVVNFFRPPAFGLEADRELVDLCNDLDLAVEDPQGNGIEGDVYDGEQFLRGWREGNRLAHRSALQAVPRPPTRDTETIESVWRWNRERDATAMLNGGYYLVPFVGYALVDDRVHTFYIHVMGENVLVPRTELVELRSDDAAVILPWSLVEHALELDADRSIDEPLQYWAVLDVQAAELLAPLLDESSIDAQLVRLRDLRATEDVT